MTGGCLCGAVRYRLVGPLGVVGVCHCSQCRRMSGHLAAFTSVGREALTVEGEVRWYESTPGAVRRGFCPVCGASLFWERRTEDVLDLWIGSLDGPSRVRIGYHVHVADKPDWYEISDGLPQHPGPRPGDEG
jgi:hypothetical protein